jgi:predicted DCC family thiol-disulfide oxidoreductase YuxK
MIERPVLLYDAECRFCRFAARLALRLDRRGRLAALPLQDPEAEPLLAGVPEAERLDSARLALPDGRLLERGEAVAAALGVPRLGPLLGRPYDLVSRSRGALAHLVPDGPAPRRFP